MSENDVSSEARGYEGRRRVVKIFLPQVDEETVDWEKGLMLGEMSVNTVICRPTHEGTVSAGSVSVQGYAITGGGAPSNEWMYPRTEGRPG
jgi:Mo-co oxidoreductase dimerisation domain